MRAFLLSVSSFSLLAACAQGEDGPPTPADPTDTASVFEAARQCDVADFVNEDVPDIGRPEFSGDVSEADRNLLNAELFLERIELQPCVYRLPSGMRIRALEPADEDAAVATPGELIMAHYEIRPAEGEVMQSSYGSDPLVSPSNRFIAGWNEALEYVRVGEEWELFIPPDLGYGLRGIPGTPVGPNTALHFRMTLVCLPARDDGGCVIAVTGTGED